MPVARVAAGVVLAAAAVVALTSTAWAPHVFAQQRPLSVALLSLGLAGFCMHATLLGMLAGAGRWSHYGSLMVIDAVIRVAVAAATFLLGWVGATAAAALLLCLPLGLETRTVVALLCGPLVGIAVHLAALAQTR